MEPTPAGDSASQKTLTPAEVHNVAFKKPPIGKRGYDEEEVDYFLDVVETELARLIEANEALRTGSAGSELSNAGQSDQHLIEENQRLVDLVASYEHQQSQAGDGSQDLRESLQTAEQRAQELQSHVETAQRQVEDGQRALEETQRQLEQTQGEALEHQRTADQARTQIEQARAEAEQARAEVQQARVQVAQARAEAEQARAQAEQASAQAEEAMQRADEAAATPDASQQAVKVLMLAQQTADQHISGAQAEADRILTEARTEAELLTEQSSSEAEARVTDAQAQAEALRRESTSQATKRIDDADAHAASVVEGLETRKANLERQLEELSIFEREYRARLKIYLESQLRDLQLGADEANDADPQAPS